MTAPATPSSASSRRHGPPGPRLRAAYLPTAADRRDRPQGDSHGHQQTQSLARLMLSPAVVLLLIWMIVPLAMTLWFSFQLYNLLYPDRARLRRVRELRLLRDRPGLLAGDPQHADPRRWACSPSRSILGILIALLIDQPIWGQGPVRILVISPFFIMPPVAALIWKNMFFNPTNGLFGRHRQVLRRCSPSTFAGYPLVLDHRHRRLAVAALRHADPAHRAPVARQRAAGGGRDGRRAASSSGSGTSCCRTWPAPSPWSC